MWPQKPVPRNIYILNSAIPWLIHYIMNVYICYLITRKTSGHESCSVHDFNFSWILHPLSKLQACLIACLKLSLDSLRVLTCSRGMSPSLRHHRPLRRSRTMKITQRQYKHQYQYIWTVLPTPTMPQQRATNSSCKFGSKVTKSRSW